MVYVKHSANIRVGCMGTAQESGKELKRWALNQQNTQEAVELPRALCNVPYMTNRRFF